MNHTLNVNTEALRETASACTAAESWNIPDFIADVLTDFDDQDKRPVDSKLGKMIASWPN